MSNVVKFELPRVESANPLGDYLDADESAARSIASDTAPALSGPSDQLPSAEVVPPGPIVEEHVRVEPKSEEVPVSPPQHFFRALLLTLGSTFALLWFMLKSLCVYAVRHPLHVMLNISMLVLLALVVVTGSEIHSQMILGKISDQTIDKIISGSRFTRQYDSDEVNRGSMREFLRVGAPVWTQRESVRAILFHARKAGLSVEDQAVLLAIADIESGFNPMARAATTTACGLFQFVKRTGEIFGLSVAECMDPWRNAEAGVAHYLYNYERRVAPQILMADSTERLFKTFELSYYLHHDGPESNNPNNDVKATILTGTQFLFRAYRALKEESESQQRAPTFTEKFAENFWKSLDAVKVFFTHFSFSRLFRSSHEDFHAAVSSALTSFAPLSPPNAEADTAGSLR